MKNKIMMLILMLGISFHGFSQKSPKIIIENDIITINYQNKDAISVKTDSTLFDFYINFVEEHNFIQQVSLINPTKGDSLIVVDRNLGIFINYIMIDKKYQATYTIEKVLVIKSIKKYKNGKIIIKTKQENCY